jgi:hypothetical protein
MCVFHDGHGDLNLLGQVKQFTSLDLKAIVVIDNFVSRFKPTVMKVL